VTCPATMMSPFDSSATLVGMAKGAMLLKSVSPSPCLRQSL
jgi:hypothetical protein